MPWTPQDAETHNAALKGQPKLQKLWADTANGTLAGYLKRGTPQAKAEGMAIATANKAVGAKLRGEPHGDQNVPAKPVRTVTPAAAVTRGDDSELRTRAGQLTPGSIDLDDHTVEAVLGTERACFSMDLKTKKSFLEVYLMSGAVLPPQVPLCDTHNRESTAKVLGSVRDLRVENDQLVGRLFVASSEYGVWGKIRDKHLTDCSWGVQPLETTEIKPGKTQIVQGRTFTAPADRSLFVHTGSPPCTWGQRDVDRHVPHAVRFTPMHMGTTASGRSSPSGPSFTPMHMGTTVSARAARRQRPVHPHAHGDNADPPPPLVL